MGRVGAAIEVRARSIRFTFLPGKPTLTINGEPVKPTPANVKYAHRLAGEIRDKIRNGSFTQAAYAEYFPDAKLSVDTALPKGPTLFGELAALWLKSKGALSPSTLAQYRSHANLWKRLIGEKAPVPDVTHAVLAAKIGEHPWKSAKAKNNCMIALRGILALEYRGRTALDSPAIGITNSTVVKKLPDPLSPTERDRVLAHMREHYDERIYAYFAFMFFTGMRPEEAIALRWSDLDETTAVIRIKRVRTFKGSERDGSKTHAERDVDLVPAAVEALRIMKAHTQMRAVEREDDDDTAADVFQNPVTRRPWHDERSQRDHYWRPTLKRLKIRQRRAYCTRHTYCTAALMGGVNPAYIAAQAGHSVKMLLGTYSRWIPGADGGSERARLSALSSPILPRPVQEAT